MPKNRNIQDISQIVEKAKNSTQRAFVNGQILKVGTNAFNIQLGGNIISQQAGKSPTYPGASLNLSAFNVLAALGVTLSHEKRNYSLLDDQTDTQIVC